MTQEDMANLSMIGIESFRMVALSWNVLVIASLGALAFLVLHIVQLLLEKTDG